MLVELGWYPSEPHPGTEIRSDADGILKQQNDKLSWRFVFVMLVLWHSDVSFHIHAEYSTYVYLC